MWSIAASIWKWMYDIESETRLNLYQEMSTRELDYLVMLPRYQAISSYHKMCDLLRKDIIVFISYDMILWHDMILGISQKRYRVEMIHNMISNSYDYTRISQRMKWYQAVIMLYSERRYTRIIYRSTSCTIWQLA